VHYMMLPLDRHFDLGFGAVADSFKEAADALSASNESGPSLGAHLPISFLYRHAIELYFKSAIIIFHRKFNLSYGEIPSSGEPRVPIEGKWKPMYNVHGLQPLYEHFRSLFARHATYLAEYTNTDWSFPDELARWISEIEETDSSSTFFRYPVTRHGKKDKDKSAIREDTYDNMLTNFAKRQTPLNAFLVVNQDYEVVEAFSHDSTPAKVVISTLSNVAQLLYGCHAALVGELTGGR
jgi:hypothetical protein